MVMMKKASHRLFIAVDLPERLKNRFEQSRPELPRIRWVPGEQLHITLHFLGNTRNDVFRKLCEDLASVEFRPFEVRLWGTGFFPTHRNPTVFWIGCHCERNELAELRKRINPVLAASGIELDQRQFQAHLTLARLKNGFNQKSRLLVEESFDELHEMDFRADSFCLYSSLLSSDGAVHKKEKVYPLN